MEWVETTGKTLEEAREAALDQLGVDEIDAEFEVLEQPKAGLFGRVRGEARVRARVRPTAPRAKDDRRDRRRRGKSAPRETSPSDAGKGATGSASEGQAGGERPRRTSGAAAEGDPASARSSNASGSTSPGGSGSAVSRSGDGGSGSASNGAGGEAPGDGTAKRRRRRRRSGGGGPDRPAQPAGVPSGIEARANGGESGAASGSDEAGRRDRTRTGGPRSEKSVESNERRDGTEVEVPLQEQGRVAEDFLSGLINEFGLSADITVTERDEDNLDLALSGHDLGLLIGQKGATLLAVQDLTRTVVQHKTSANNGRIHVDVGGYRQKRSEALAKFAHEVAAKVKQTGERTALEPMSSADRKVVHDAITELEGVTTISEGEEPRRRVVVLPSE